MMTMDIMLGANGQMPRLDRFGKVAVTVLVMTLCVLLTEGIRRYNSWRHAMQLERYDETVERILWLMENFDDTNGCDKVIDAWGREMEIQKVGANIYIKSLGACEHDETDDIKAQRIYSASEECNKFRSYSQDVFYVFEGVIYGGGENAD